MFRRVKRTKPMSEVTSPSLIDEQPSPAGSDRRPAGARLTEADAIDIWIARWLRIRRKDILARYGCDPRRIYEIWAEETFIGSRAKALAAFAERFPGLQDRIDTSRHRKLARPGVADTQLKLFDEPPQPLRHRAGIGRSGRGRKCL